MMKNIPVFCGKDCGGDACPLLAAVEDGRVTRVVNNPAGGKYLKGCPRGFNLPLDSTRRTDSSAAGAQRAARFGPVPPGQLGDALDLTARSSGDIRTRYGPNAVLSRGSAGHRRPARHPRAFRAFLESVWRLHPVDE